MFLIGANENQIKKHKKTKKQLFKTLYDKISPH
jgi:hypothetical protein